MSRAKIKVSWRERLVDEGDNFYIELSPKVDLKVERNDEERKKMISQIVTAVRKGLNAKKG